MSLDVDSIEPTDAKAGFHYLKCLMPLQLANVKFILISGRFVWMDFYLNG